MKPDGGKEYNIEEILGECISAKPMFFSGGGVTFTGGEATVQYDELLNLLKLLKSEDIHTCIETNGTHPKLFEMADYIDYLIMNFKHFDSDMHKKYTGVGNEVIKYNYEKICKSGRRLHIFWV